MGYGAAFPVPIDEIMPLPLEAIAKRLESIVHRDPARRGVAGLAAGPAGPAREGATHCTHDANQGQLLAAASSLSRGLCIGIVTGFCVVDDGQVAAETDGPPGGCTWPAR